MSQRVKAWEETITFPTYPPAAADLNPMFLEKRVNQGTSGRVYPQPFTDGLSSESEPRDYQAVYLENDYLRLMMLPQIGGRIHEAYDKTSGYHMIYRQHVVKPALIGLFGAWISGGMEFNWPQHHRPSTFMPVTHVIEKHEDGSVTVWLSENDPLQRMKGMVGICLYPDKAYFEMKVQIYNRTPETQTFLWWINAGVHTHDDYQVVFPPDVTVVTDHSKRSMAHYPIAKGSYYGKDYSNDGAGTDISWYKNIPVSTSYFVWHTDEDFFGGYDHKADAGIIHVANRFVAPGKKMFTWGNGESAKGWEANLTDQDGPYIELMAGVYTDNQPDFSWLQPYETKTFSQIWYPVQKIGPAKQANRRAALNLEREGDRVKVGVAVTEVFNAAVISLTAGECVLLQGVVNLAPGAPFVARVEMPDGMAETDLLLRLQDAAGYEVIRCRPALIEQPPLPECKTPPPPPETFDSIEELYLTGLHLEQYRHPTIEPEPYWLAALKRDPNDVRCNNAMGLVYLRRGLFDQAITHFNTAIERLTRRNPNPRDGEVYFNLGQALKYKGDLDAAYAAFYKAIWSYAWQAAGFYALAEIDGLRGDYVTALDHLRRSLVTNAMNMKARGLKAAVLRKLGRFDEAAGVCCETVSLDPLDMMARHELALQSQAQNKTSAAQGQLAELASLMTTPDPLSDLQALFDMAFDYANAGYWQEAFDLLARWETAHPSNASPMMVYAQGFFAYQLGRTSEGLVLYQRASTLPPDYCFPVRLEEMLVLQHAHSVMPDDGRVAYYLANLTYDKKRYDEAIALWEQAASVEPDWSIPWRNLGIAYYNVRHQPERAIACYEQAAAAAPQDGRVLSELDQLRGRTGVKPQVRLDALEAHLPVVRRRDDLSVILSQLYNRTGEPQKALDFMLSRRFHPWEGGTGSISRQYVIALLKLGQAALAAGDASGALRSFETALATYPPNLGERKHSFWPDADVHYYTGLAKQALGDTRGAEESFNQVLVTRSWLSEVYYYQALALRAMGREGDAQEKLRSLKDEAQKQLDEQAQRGFATSIPQFVFVEADMETRRRVYLTYLIGLAHLGLGETSEAKQSFEAVIALDVDHADAYERLAQLNS